MKRIILIASFLFSVVAFAQPGAIDLTFNPGIGPNGSVRTTSIQSDGKIIIGGNFTSYNGITRNRIARLNTDGTLDTSFNIGTGANNVVYTTSLQSDGKIIIGGDFTTYDGITRNRIARLNSDGTLDTTFNPGIGASSFVFTTSIQSDGRIIIGGAFTTYNDITRNRIARLNTDATLDITFDPGTGSNGSTVCDIAIQSNGKIIIVGDFNTYNGTTRYGIARLNTSGTLDSTFTFQNGPNNIFSVSIQSNGLLIIGGFNMSSTPPFKGIACLNTNGFFNSTFNIGTGINYRINSTSIQSDGKIIIGGLCTSYNDVMINNIARLNTDGTLDNAFNTGTGVNSYIYTTSIQSDGKIIIGGDFTSYNGFGKNRIARINGGSALSSIGFENNVLNIYPNPSNGVYTLQTNEMNAAKFISIYTFLGQKIYDTVISSNETIIDISSQPKGVYLYKVFGEEGETKSGKLVIE